jgi:hypothetical protein
VACQWPMATDRPVGQWVGSSLADREVMAQLGGSLMGLWGGSLVGQGVVAWQAHRLVGGQQTDGWCSGRAVAGGPMGRGLVSLWGRGLVCLWPGSGVVDQWVESGGVGLVAHLFFQCIVVQRSLPWARGSGC